MSADQIFWKANFIALSNLEMCKRLFSIAITAVVIVFVTVDGSSTDAQTTEEQNNIAPVVFDAAALSQTIKELKTATSVDFIDTQLEDALKLFRQRHKFQFKIVASEPAPVTIKMSGQFGEMLLQLLATIDCEYAILPNGVIVVRDSLKKLTD